MMDINSIFWPDSEIVEIHYSDDCIRFVIHDDWGKKCFNLVCKEVCGLDNLSLWEDFTIKDAEWIAEIDKESETGRKLYNFYGDYESMSEYLTKICALKIELIDERSFTVFCRETEVTENMEYTAKLKDDGLGSSL